MGNKRIYVSEKELRALQERIIDEFGLRGLHSDGDDDARLDSGEFLRGRTFIFTPWTAPPSEWVSVTRRDDGAISRVSMRREPGSPGSPDDEPSPWDHDHCALCTRQIGGDAARGAEPAGWRTGENWGNYAWVCARCFDDYESRLDWKRADSR